MIPKNIYEEVSTYVGRGALPEGGGGIPNRLELLFLKIEEYGRRICGKVHEFRGR